MNTAGIPLHPTWLVYVTDFTPVGTGVSLPMILLAGPGALWAYPEFMVPQRQPIRAVPGSVAG